MFMLLKRKFKEFNSAVLPPEFNDKKRYKILFYVSFYLILLSTFLTVVSQFPAFTARGITQLFQVGWIFSLVPLFMLDYKRVLKCLFVIVTLLLPFLLYCVFALVFKTNSISYGGTSCVFISVFLFLIFGTFGKYKNSLIIKSVATSFLVSTLLYAGVVFLTKLMGYDLDNQIYAFADKNSAGPIFISAAIMAFYIFDKRKAGFIVLKWLIFAFFLVIIALSKTRSVLITIPIILFILLFRDIRNLTISFLTLAGFIGAVILIFAVPYFRETIIINILLNGKTDIDSIFSGRLSSIVLNMQNFQPLLGTGGTYFDCMILSFLCSYGIIGFVLLIPLLVFPFFILIGYRKKCNDQNVKTLVLCFVIVFIVSALLEGYGYFGPGAKVFIFWFLVGSYSFDVLPLLANNKISNKYLAMQKHVVSISKPILLVVIQILLLGVSLLSISISSFSFSIGQTIVDKLPSSNSIASYVEVKDIQINPPVKSMCVGQKITFDVKSDPAEAEDKSVYWSTGWITNSPISVDSYTGEVTANKTGNALLHIDRFRVGPNGTYIQFPIKEIDDYIFDQMFISTHEFNKSFDHIEDESIVLNQGCSSKVFYDDYYLPDETKIQFVSSDPSIAQVENGIIKAKSPGGCQINAIIHGKIDTISKNSINITVANVPYFPSTSIDLDVNHDWYQYQQYEINPIFNKDASDQNFSIFTSGIECSVKNNLITFLESGTANLKIVSDSNNLLEKEYQFFIRENKPVQFECETKRMLIGETKNAEQLGLCLVFENGYRKIVTDDDLFFDARDFTNRAWSDKNGLVKNRTTVKAVLSGYIKLNCVSKIDHNVQSTFKIISSVYTQDQYDNLTKGVGQLALTIILLISLSFSVFVTFEKEWLVFVFLYATSACFITIEGLLFGPTIYFLVSIISILTILSLITILRLLKKNWFPLPFLEEPIEITVRDEFEKQALMFYQLEI